MSQRINKNDLSNEQQGRRNKQYANSQFIRQKLEFTYNPTLRWFNKDKSPFNESNSLRQSQFSRTNIQQDIFDETKYKITTGKNIMIDWSAKSNFIQANLPKFPNVRFSTSVDLQSKYSKMSEKKSLDFSFTKRKDQKKFLNEYEKNCVNKQSQQFIIKEKSDYLTKLLSQKQPEAISLRKNRNRIKKVITEGSTQQFEENKQLIQNPNNLSIGEIPQTRQYFLDRSSITQKINLKQQKFFKSNFKSLHQAMNYEHRIKTEPTIPRQIKMKKSLVQARICHKSKFEHIRERILVKSKLTLLKSDLLKKFKEIRQGVLEQEETRNQNIPYSPINFNNTMHS